MRCWECRVIWFWEKVMWVEKEIKYLEVKVKKGGVFLEDG